VVSGRDFHRARRSPSTARGGDREGVVGEQAQINDGSFTTNSVMTNAIKTTTPTLRKVRVVVSLHPFEPASVMPYTRVVKPPWRGANPGYQSASFLVRLDRSRVPAGVHAGSESQDDCENPDGILMVKMAFQSNVDSDTPKSGTEAGATERDTHHGGDHRSLGRRNSR